jgi:hypothetical protein
MKFGKALEMFNRLGSLSERYLDRDLVIEVYNPGSIGGTPCTKVAAIVQGIDWDGGKIILSPGKVNRGTHTKATKSSKTRLRHLRLRLPH